MVESDERRDALYVTRTMSDTSRKGALPICHACRRQWPQYSHTQILGLQRRGQSPPCSCLFPSSPLQQSHVLSSHARSQASLRLQAFAFAVSPRISSSISLYDFDDAPLCTDAVATPTTASEVDYRCKSNTSPFITSMPKPHGVEVCHGRDIPSYVLPVLFV